MSGDRGDPATLTILPPESIPVSGLPPPETVNPLAPPVTPTIAPSLVNPLAPSRVIPAGTLAPTGITPTISAPSVTSAIAPPSVGPPSMALVRGSPSKDDPRGMMPVIRSAAIANGIDPDVAIRVARSEGLSGFRSGVIREDGTEEPSWGAFQLYTGGGMGNDFHRDTGLDPSDPANEEATIWYAMDKARQGGWGPWHGAKKAGIAQWEGIKQGFTPTMRPQFAAASTVQPDQPTPEQTPTLPTPITQPPLGMLGSPGLLALAMGLASRRISAANISYDPWTARRIGQADPNIGQSLASLGRYTTRIGRTVPGPAGPG